MLDRLDTAAAAFIQGMAQVKSRGYRDAVRAFQETLARDPDYPHAAENLATAREIVDYVERVREQSDTGDAGTTSAAVRSRPPVWRAFRSASKVHPSETTGQFMVAAAPAGTLWPRRGGLRPHAPALSTTVAETLAAAPPRRPAGLGTRCLHTPAADRDRAG